MAALHNGDEANLLYWCGMETLDLSDFWGPDTGRDIPGAISHISIYGTISSSSDYPPPLITPVPEPSTKVLFGFGFIGLAGVSRKKLVK